MTPRTSSLAPGDVAVLLGHLATDDEISSREAYFKDIPSPFPPSLYQNQLFLCLQLGSHDLRETSNPVDLNDSALSDLDHIAVTFPLDSITNTKSHVLKIPSRAGMVSNSVHVVLQRRETPPVALFTLMWKSPNSNPEAQASAILTPTQSMWRERNPLSGQLCTPVMQSGRVIGRLLFEFLIITPFPLASGLTPLADEVAQSDISVPVIGHRGLGKNNPIVKGTGGKLQLGENTLLSFRAAQDAGAKAVEFDVQLTKDSIPVIYHDCRRGLAHLAEGSPLPLHDIPSSTFFRALPSQHPAAEMTNGWSGKGGLRRIRSESDMLPRSASSFYPVPKWANGRGTIREAFVSLAQALNMVDPELIFNIELKYPNLLEAERENLSPPELNHFCDTVLQVVGSSVHASRRQILFSSFHPELCLAVRLKQSVHPVYFLTDGGTHVYPDVRLNSLREAIVFAKEYGLTGIVTAAAPLIQAPALIPYIRRDCGLELYSYGGLNNDLANSRLQLEAGSTGVIVDDVWEVVGAMKRDHWKKS